MQLTRLELEKLDTPEAWAEIGRRVANRVARQRAAQLDADPVVTEADFGADADELVGVDEGDGESVDVPSADDLMWPTLMAMRSIGGPARIAEIDCAVADQLDLPHAVLAVPSSNGRQTAFEYNLGWVRTKLKTDGLIDNPARGIWELTDLGEDAMRDVLGEAEQTDVPSADDLMWPTLAALKSFGRPARIAEIEHAVADHLDLPDAVLEIPSSNGRKTAFRYNLDWARTYLKREGLADNPARGIWALTELAEGVDGEDAMRDVIELEDSDDEHVSEALVSLRNSIARISEHLTGDVDWSKLIAAGESNNREFKATLRTNLHTGKRDRRIEFAVLKTLAAFLNTNGGTLFIGVADDGTPVGVADDRFDSEDKMSVHLSNIGNARLGPIAMSQVQMQFQDVQGVRVLIVRCPRSRNPVYVKDDRVDRFYIRTGAVTYELGARDMREYFAQHFDSGSASA